MENILTQFNTDNLNIKLTSEKLFILTPTSNEAFALRSVNGVGVIDLVDEYNKELSKWDSKSKAPFWLFLLGGLALLGSFGTKSSDDIAAPLVFGLAAIGGGYYLLEKKKKEKPNLMSAVRIMMSGGNRDFQFDKTGVGSGNIAEFVAKVESTLTSYHKNNG